MKSSWDLRLIASDYKRFFFPISSAHTSRVRPTMVIDEETVADAYRTLYQMVQRYNCGTSMFGLLPAVLFFVFAWRLSDTYVSTFVHLAPEQLAGRARRRHRDRRAGSRRWRWLLYLTKVGSARGPSAESLQSLQCCQVVRLVLRVIFRFRKKKEFLRNVRNAEKTVGSTRVVRCKIREFFDSN